jgi:uncharacterized delta-60 repeat protein
MKTIYKYSILIICFFVNQTKAQSFDSTFGTNGKVHTSFGNFSVYFSSITMQNDGKIYAAGAREGLGVNGIFISKYNSDGSLDTSYNSLGINGVPSTKEISYGSNYQFCHTIVLQPDNKLIVAGSSNGDFALARLNQNGNYDTDFSNDGQVIFSFGAGNGSKINKVLLQPDGKIIAVGQAYNGVNFDFGIARFNTDGSLDTTFGTAGKILIPIGPANDFGQDAVLQPDGKIVITGYSNNSSGDSISIARLNSNGSLDNTFAANGKIYYNIPSKEYCVAEAIALQSDGKILVAGHANGDFALLRYNTNGILDNSFGNLGYTTTDFGNFQDKVYAISIRQDGRILLAGHSYEPSISTFLDFGIASYNSNGSLDNTFDSDGKMTISMGYSSGIRDMLFQPDGKLLFGGNSIENSSSNTRYSLLRLSDSNLSVNENNFNDGKATVYPNPTNEFVTILTTNTIDKMELFTIHGQELNIANKIMNNTINISGLDTGIYILKLNGAQTFKINKQ